MYPGVGTPNLPPPPRRLKHVNISQHRRVNMRGKNKHIQHQFKPRADCCSFTITPSHYRSTKYLNWGTRNVRCIRLQRLYFDTEGSVTPPLMLLSSCVCSNLLMFASCTCVCAFLVVFRHRLHNQLRTEWTSKLNQIDFQLQLQSPYFPISLMVVEVVPLRFLTQNSDFSTDAGECNQQKFDSIENWCQQKQKGTDLVNHRGIKRADNNINWKAITVNSFWTHFLCCWAII